ncbi:WhiB family transcriptional regulator [Streptomyces sp. NBC_01233]|uniref:WhiB family transcriptional regulator n=1 Tax=Streptomyces sp. NBC_01233 TaxID=2903787 RepID=UPI002E0DBF8E|nr:WhiB family transcriptional regulator [Streptomyces sp. NBC_01233]
MKSRTSVRATAPEWMSDGLCAQTDPTEFYPDRGGSVAVAKKVCAACDVRTNCLDYALTNGEEYGVWGGLSERERHRLTTPATTTALGGAA